MFINIFNTEKKYKIILCDCPWTFETYSEKGKDRSAEQHYQCLSLEDLKKLPIAKIAEKDAVLFHWVTNPMLIKGIEVMKAWGFTYKTIAFNWIKANKSADLKKLNVDKDIFMGLGYYSRQNSELCLLGENNSEENEKDLILLGTKGKILERQSKSVRQVLITHRREHSRKPDEIYKKIIDLFGDLPRIELFARQQVEGWDCWGNSIDKFIAKKEEQNEKINPNI